MTNEEKKSNEIATEYLLGHDKLEITYEEMREAVMEMVEWKDKQYTEIIKEECNTSYESGLAEGERKAEARFKEYLNNAIKSYKSRGEAFFATEIKTIESIINKLLEE